MILQITQENKQNHLLLYPMQQRWGTIASLLTKIITTATISNNY